MKAIISGGGTGGHVFPAIAIANAIKKRYPDADILFVGAKGKMEMEKVPAAGYRIEGLPIAGLQRKLTLRNIALNLAVPFKMAYSQAKVRRMLRTFQPDIVVGVGGYASAPTLRTAERMGFPTLLQEQNSYPGLANRMLAKSAKAICVAYEGLDKYFPAEKITLTGNPVRAAIEDMACTREEGIRHFALKGERPIVLSVGGSLGASSINRMIMRHLDFFLDHKIQLIWQTGKWMYDEAVRAVQEAGAGEWVEVHQFISRMDYAYSAADVIISRAGAIAISELCLVGKPVILIPSPNVAEDHQTRNARALSDKGAAMLLPDAECGAKGMHALFELMGDEARRKEMGEAILKLGKRQAADRIVDEIDKIVFRKKGVDTEPREEKRQ